MSALYNLLHEGAGAGSTTAHAIAAIPTRDSGQTNKKKSNHPSEKKVKSRKIFIMRLKEGSDTFNTSDVISKLDAAEKKVKAGTNTIAFGLEDNNGNITKVFVRADQADDFEHQLSDMMADLNHDDDKHDNNMPEVAEILHKLSSTFDIIDVNWGTIEGDEEEEMLDGEETDDVVGDDIDGAAGVNDEPDSDNSIESSLTSIIDMLKADIESRKAASEADKAEAEAKISEYAAKAAEEKIKQEEEVLDMEAHEKEKKDDENETKRLASLARFRHEQRGDEETDDEDEEEGLTQDDLISLLHLHLKSNN